MFQTFAAGCTLARQPRAAVLHITELRQVQASADNTLLKKMFVIVKWKSVGMNTIISGKGRIAVSKKTAFHGIIVSTADFRLVFGEISVYEGEIKLGQDRFL